ncbi:MAG: hypothetical protein KBG28_12890 [Kofleriaceae bacterium]|nr:hypothetical protein [Kofleriaceae bacterium]MBP6839493.1 hypothetical protein [Kofleriaceae bacterium]MBP9204859.1 hypothetical protein [Kofleriaceae bacterium]
MSSEDEDALLRQIGLIIDDPSAGELRAECGRIARRLHLRATRVIGFVPADDTIAVPPLLVHLGLALTQLTGATIALVDANVRYPGLSQLAVARAGEDSVFSTRWLRGSLALLTPPRVERAGEVLPQLERALDAGGELFAHMLVDLTGFDLLGEHAAAAARMDAVALVGRARHTHDEQLKELARQMPADRFLGVVLVG